MAGRRPLHASSSTVARTLAHCCNVVEDGARPMLLMQAGKEVYFYELDWIDGEFHQEAFAFGANTSTFGL